MWIRAEDGLPEGYCLALVSDGRHVTLGGWERVAGWRTSREDGAFGINDQTITHWMPLPEPPAADESEAGVRRGADKFGEAL